ncbi:MAG: 16S rRNA (uracil(1498)-N(3))-methyltransferase [Burkholderiales bacterium]|nr:16S rRNA (uracil(1498)-N(3))-methyltransferase [Burkholderiales bacterium]
MVTPRFCVPAPLSAADVGREFELPDAQAHHALRVLRLAVGDALTVFTGDGGEFAATLVHAGKRAATVQLDTYLTVEREPTLAVTLVQGICASDTMDAIIRHAVELGAAGIAPVVTARGARFPSGPHGTKRLAHWRQVVVAACEQCGRNRLPPVHDVVAFADWCRMRESSRAGIALDPGADRALAVLPAVGGALDLLVGPEGGFAPDEAARARAAGCTPARLGPRILRVETASLAALAAVHALWGDLR